MTVEPTSREEEAMPAAAIARAIADIDRELASRRWMIVDPERRKALSRARDFLQRILEGCGSERELWLAAGIAERVGATVLRRGRENAWDFAEELRSTSYAFASDEMLLTLLRKERADTTSLNYRRLFGASMPDDLLKDISAHDFRARALTVLRRLHHERVDRVRHDRTRDRLWLHFVVKLIPLFALLLGVCLHLEAYEVPADDEGSGSWDTGVLLAAAAGALGSLLSSFLKARDGEQRIRHLRRSASFLLLQPMIGATAGLAMVWLGVAHVFRVDVAVVNAQAVVGFLAGFSEPFFLGTLNRLGDLAASEPKAAPSGEPGEPPPVVARKPG